MTVPSGTMQYYQQIGVREDLSDIINNISPRDTPFYSRAEKVKATQVTHEWQTDALDAPQTNAQIEGNDAVINTATPSVRIKNYTQILTKAPQVSGRAQVVNTAGRADEMDYQKMKRGLELRNDIEYALVRNQASSAGSGSVASMTAGLESWIASNITSVGTGTAQTTPGYATGNVAAPTDSTVLGSVSESIFKSVLASVYTAGGDPGLVMCGPSTKQKFSTFGGIATQYRDNAGTSQATILGAADVYVSDYGQLDIVPNRKVRNNTAIILDMDYWRVATLRPIGSQDLAKTGDSDKALLLAELCLEAGNEKASGKIADIDPTK